MYATLSESEHQADSECARLGAPPNDWFEQITHTTFILINKQSSDSLYHLSTKTEVISKLTPYTTITYGILYQELARVQ